MLHCFLTDSVRETDSSYFLSVTALAIVASDLKPSLRGVEAVAFKTMVALYVEVEPVHWEKGSPSSGKPALMAGIQGQCQVQVEIWILVVGRRRSFAQSTKPGGLIQSSTMVREYKDYTAPATNSVH